MPEPLAAALDEVGRLLTDPTALIRGVGAGRRRGATPAWRRVDLRPVDIGAGRWLQITTYDETQALTANHEFGEPAARQVATLLAEPFGNWHVEAVGRTVQVRVTKRGEAQVHRAATSQAAPERAEHDRVKARLVDPREPYLFELGITTAEGRVKPTRQDKYRQVEEFVRSLDAAVAQISAEHSGRPLRVVDLGCGNAYLTLAAYRHLTETRDQEVELIGVDVKTQARQRNTAIVERLGWADRVRFVEGAIGDVDVERPDVVLALHACDTATDDALARGVGWDAPLILAAPCCHHDVQRQIQSSGLVPPAWAGVVRYGILRERFADVLTDAFRASLLRLLGYRVDVVEFVASQHTPRNTLIRAQRTGAAPQAEVARDYRELTAAWGVTPRLQQLLADRVADVVA
ncbi:MAG: SAM-dependent methyltransferase [Candidatus Nanopelagicales bacterium]